jgi:hypothetical protein
VNRARTLLLVTTTALLLTACTPTPSPSPTPTSTPSSSASASNPQPTASSASPAPQPTGTAEETPTAPQSAIGVDCDAFATDGELQELFAEPMPFALGDLPSDDDVLVQAGATLCRWGDGPFLDGPLAEFTLAALPTRDEDFAGLVDRVSASEYAGSPAPVPGLGDEAVVRCDVYGSETASCDWGVRVGTVWLAIGAVGLPSSELEVTEQSEYRSSGVPRTDAAISRLLLDAVGVIAEAPLRETAPPRTGSTCADILDTDAVAADLDIAPVTLEPQVFAADVPSFSWAIESLWAEKASAELGITSCAGSLGEWSPDYHAGSLFVEVLPAGAWLEDSELWPDADEVLCRGWEGGPVCDLTLYGDEAATWIRTTGDDREAAMQSVRDHLQIPGLP